jgi:hypothetical protein
LPITDNPPIFSVASGAEFSILLGPSERDYPDSPSDFLFDVASVQMVRIRLWDYQRGDGFIVSRATGGSFKELTDEIARANVSGTFAGISALIDEASRTLPKTDDSGARRGIEVVLQAVGNPHTRSELWTVNYDGGRPDTEVARFRTGVVEIGDRLDVTATPSPSPSESATPAPDVPCVTPTVEPSPEPAEATGTASPTESPFPNTETAVPSHTPSEPVSTDTPTPTGDVDSTATPTPTPPIAEPGTIIATEPEE